MDNFLTVNEISEKLRVQRRTVIRWIRAGQLRAFKPGGGRFWRIREADFKRFIRAGSEAQKHSAGGATPSIG